MAGRTARRLDELHDDAHYNARGTAGGRDATRQAGLLGGGVNGVGSDLVATVVDSDERGGVDGVRAVGGVAGGEAGQREEEEAAQARRWMLVARWWSSGVQYHSVVATAVDGGEAVAGAGHGRRRRARADLGVGVDGVAVDGVVGCWCDDVGSRLRLGGERGERRWGGSWREERGREQKREREKERERER